MLVGDTHADMPHLRWLVERCEKPRDPKPSAVEEYLDRKIRALLEEADKATVDLFFNGDKATHPMARRIIDEELQATHDRITARMESMGATERPTDQRMCSTTWTGGHGCTLWADDHRDHRCCCGDIFRVAFTMPPLSAEMRADIEAANPLPPCSGFTNNGDPQ